MIKTSYKLNKKTGELSFPFDNAGIIFVPASSKSWVCAYRVSVVLNQTIDPSTLEQAVNLLVPRFPSLFCTLQRDAFKNYLRTNTACYNVTKEVGQPMKRLSIKSGSRLLRVMYNGNRIIIECFHGLADATGGLKLLCSIVKQYLTLKGHSISNHENCLEPSESFDPEEIEDAFIRYSSKGHKCKIIDKKAMQFSYTKSDEFAISYYSMDACELKAVAKKYGATIGELLTTCLAYTFYKEKATDKKIKHPIKISVPVDCRRKFPSKTVRNFALYKNMPVDANANQTFDSVLAEIKNSYSQITDEYLLTMIHKNVTLANSMFFKSILRPVKDLALGLGYDALGENLTTTSFSNMGVLKTPPEFNDFVDRFEFNLGPLKLTPINFACVGYKDKILFSVSSRAKNTNFENSLQQLFDKLNINYALDKIEY